MGMMNKHNVNINLVHADLERITANEVCDTIRECLWMRIDTLKDNYAESIKLGLDNKDYWRSELRKAERAYSVMSKRVRLG